MKNSDPYAHSGTSLTGYKISDGWPKPSVAKTRGDVLAAKDLETAARPRAKDRDSEILAGLPKAMRDRLFTAKTNGGASYRTQLAAEIGDMVDDGRLSTEQGATMLRFLNTSVAPGTAQNSDGSLDVWGELSSLTTANQRRTPVA